MADVTNGEIIVAAIGLVGVVATAIISNWDKLHGGRVVEPYTGYAPTPNGDFEQELRIFFEVAGTRKAIEVMQIQVIDNMGAQMTAENPEDTDIVRQVLDVAKEEALRYDELMQEIAPIYRKYFTVSQIQQLNKFYSTQSMRDMCEKLPLVQTEMGPIMNRLSTVVRQRMDRHMRDLAQSESPEAAPNAPPE